MSRFRSENPPVANGHRMSTEERFLRYKKQLHEQLISAMDLSTIGNGSHALWVERSQNPEYL